MANEIKIGISLSVTKNGATYTRSDSFSDDMTGNAWISGVQQVTTTEDIITHEDITTYGWVYLKNLGTDSSLYVDFGRETIADATDKICRLYGGESCIIKTAGLTAVHALSSSGTQAVEYAIIEL
jgi:hypothetical protein